MFNCYAIFKIYVKRNNIFISAIFRANVVNCTVIRQDSFLLLMNPYFFDMQPQFVTLITIYHNSVHHSDIISSWLTGKALINVAISCHWHKLKILWNIIWNLYQKLQHFSKTLISPIMNMGNAWIYDNYLFLFVYFIGSVITKQQQQQPNNNKKHYVIISECSISFHVTRTHVPWKWSFIFCSE